MAPETDKIIVRQFHENEWDLLKATRIRALGTDAEMFGKGAVDPAEAPDSFWQDMVSSKDMAVFGLFVEKQPIGMSYIVKEGSQAMLRGSWIDPTHRKKGITQQFYNVRLDWARQNGVEKLTVFHREGNLASEKAIKGNGFSHTHTVDMVFTNGSTGKAVYYARTL